MKLEETDLQKSGPPSNSDHRNLVLLTRGPTSRQGVDGHILAVGFPSEEADTPKVSENSTRDCSTATGLKAKRMLGIVTGKMGHKVIYVVLGRSTLGFYI
ncbi:hypothetical protein TWF718_010329 [Orbilia javanica]|uniref:Uncharacterized protein n=1 Tax=Orbilia javanica TaxID=47235 RepID=A0AAN8NPG1_9PEZI